MRYRVWGYTDEDPESPTVIAAFDTKAKAVEYAELSTMAIEIEDYTTGQIVWMYEADHWRSAWREALDAR